MKYPYFNPHRKQHGLLMEALEKESRIENAKSLRMVKYGERTQHIFIDSKYYMTVNWALV